MPTLGRIHGSSRPTFGFFFPFCSTLAPFCCFSGLTLRILVSHFLPTSLLLWSAFWSLVSTLFPLLRSHLWILVPFCFHLPQLWVRFWQGRPPFCVAFASGHNMLHDSAVLRDMDPMNGVAATLLPKRNVILGQRSGGSCPLQQFSRNHDHYKRGQDPNALVFNVDGRFESLKRNSAAAVQVLLQGRADPNLATGRRLCRSVC